MRIPIIFPCICRGTNGAWGILEIRFLLILQKLTGLMICTMQKVFCGKQENRAANLYGSEETHFLINGSTGGILSAVAGCVPQGGTLLMARNCHKSVYHAALLGNLKTHYIYPQPADQMLINGPILASDVEKELKQHQDIQAVFLTSPTYDGVVSDVRSIAEVVHKKNLPAYCG